MLGCDRDMSCMRCGDEARVCAKLLKRPLREPVGNHFRVYFSCTAPVNIRQDRPLGDYSSSTRAGRSNTASESGKMTRIKIRSSASHTAPLPFWNYCALARSPKTSEAFLTVHRPPRAVEETDIPPMKRDGMSRQRRVTSGTADGFQIT